MRGERDLLRALAALIGLGLATVALAGLQDDIAGWHKAAAVAVLLLLAGLKAEIILSRYLGLAAAPSWLHGFRAAVIALAAILFVFWLIPMLSGGEGWQVSTPAQPSEANSALA